MKTHPKIFLTLLVAFPFFLSSQSSYKAGYIVDNAGNTLEVEIRERNWLSNPTTITYRTAKGQKPTEASIADLSAFGLTKDGQQFIREIVEIEQSTDIISQLTSVSTPVFATDTVWLRQFVDGKADLFYWSDGKLSRYFFRLDNSPITPLISRKYRTGPTQMRTDNRFRNTLANALSCEGELPDPQRLNYTKTDLLAYISAYNLCEGGAESVLTSRKGPPIRIAIRAGAERHNLVYTFPGFAGINSRTYSWDSKITPVFGIEVEQALEFTNRRWSVFGGLNYRRLQQAAEENSREYQIDYQSLEIDLGTRFRVLDFNRNSVFVLGSLGSNVVLGNSNFTRGRSSPYDMRFNFSPTLGAGIRLGAHLELEARYRIKHELLNRYRALFLKDSGIMLTLAYRR